MALIEYRGVSKRYGEAWALRDFDLDIPEGKLVALIGPSGSGKTTALRMANRLVEPDRGEIAYRGRSLGSWKPEELRRGMGYVIQGVGLFPHRSVIDNVLTVPRLLGTPRSAARERAGRLLALVGLEPGAYAHRLPRELSGGEAQRVGVARALAADPPVLLMDEPFGAVDPLQRKRLQGEFLKIQAELKKTVLLVTHDLDEAVRLADTVVLMRSGRIVQIAAPAALLAAPTDEFARDFVGEERALKRLARVGIASIAREALRVRIGERAPKAEDGCAESHAAWVVDAEGRPRGRVRAGEEARLSTGCLPLISSEASLREALAVMLEGGSPELGLIDAEGRLAGEVDLEAMLASSAAAMAESGR